MGEDGVMVEYPEWGDLSPRADDFDGWPIEAIEMVERLRAESAGHADDAKRLHKDKCDALDRIFALEQVLKAYEQLEADLILENSCWAGRETPQFTQELWDRMIEIQHMRNTALRQFTAAWALACKHPTNENSHAAKDL